MSQPLLAFKMLNNLVTGRMSGSQLETALADPADRSALGGFLSLIEQRAPVKMMTVSAPAMNAITTSPTAREIFLASEYRVGRGLNTLAVAGGATSNPTLAGMASMNVIAGSTKAMSTIIGSPAVLAALVVSSAVMGIFAVNSVAMTGIATSAAAMTAIVGSASVIAMIVGSATALAAIYASGTAMPIVAASAGMMSAITASATASTALWASNNAADAVLTNSTAKLAVYNSDTALAALQATPVQVQRQIDTIGRVTTHSSASTGAYLSNGTRTILLRRRYSGTDNDTIGWARGSTTAEIGQGPAGGGRQLDTGVMAVASVSGTYTAMPGTLPVGNNDASNFVSAANGLQRRTASRETSVTLTLQHIPVGA